MGVGGNAMPQLLYPLGKTWYPLYSRMGGPLGWCGQVQKILPLPGFNPRTVQPVASRYTDLAVLAHNVSWCLREIN
jgi:hypothetical protein